MGSFAAFDQIALGPKAVEDAHEERDASNREPGPQAATSGPALRQQVEARGDDWPELPAAQAGQAAAVEAIVRRLLPRVRNLCRYLSRGDQGVDDAAQDALIALVRGLGSFRGEGRFEAWSDRVVARAYFRSRRSAPESLVEPAEVASLVESEGWENNEDFAARRLVVRQLDELPEAQRQALVLHHVVGMSVPEIAGVANCAEETVRSRLRLGRGRMRRSLAPSAACPDAKGEEQA